MAASVREDLYYGAVYGLALSACIWTLMLAPPTDSTWLVPLAIATVAGTLRLRARFLGPLHPTYPAVLANGLLFGPGAAVLAGVLCELSATLCRPRACTRGSARHAAFAVGTTALAAALAGLALFGTTGMLVDRAGEGWLRKILPLVAHATAFAVTRQALVWLALCWVVGRRRFPRRIRRSLGVAATYALGSALAVALAGLYAEEASRPWLAAAALLVVTETIRRARRDAQRSRVRLLAETAAGQPDRGIDAPIEHTLRVEDRCESPRGKGGLSLSLHELEILYDISGAMDYGLDLQAYLTLVSCKLAPLVPYRSFVAYFVDESQDLLRAGYATGQAAAKLRWATVPMGQRWSGRAAASRRTLIGQVRTGSLAPTGSTSDLEDWGTDPEISGLTTSLVAPLLDDGRVTGVLSLYADADRVFTADDKRILARVSGYVAQVVRRSRQSPSPAGSSLTDPLTGVPNARFLWLESAHRLSAPETQGFGLLAFRVMGIERIVEGEGNAGADRLLCEVARRFAACSRTGETQVRFGQDLFIVLTPNHDPVELVERWHALATDVEQPAWPDRTGEERRIRLAAAHASYPEDGQTLDALLEALDARLGCVNDGRRTVVPFRARRAAALAGT